MAGVELVYFRLLDINADNLETRFREFNGEWQADIAETQNAHARFFGLYFVLEIRRNGRNREHSLMDQYHLRISGVG
jgi:hypothetical protein